MWNFNRMITGRVNHSDRRKIRPSANCLYHKFHIHIPYWKPGLSDEKPATKILQYDTRHYNCHEYSEY